MNRNYFVIERILDSNLLFQSYQNIIIKGRSEITYHLERYKLEEHLEVFWRFFFKKK